MGALTSNRKRGDDYIKTLSFSTPFDHSCAHISKKPKLSLAMIQTTPETNRASASSNSVVSRIAQYPDRKPGFQREVHAPVKNLRFGSPASAKNSESTASSRETPADKMGAFGFFWRRLTCDKFKTYDKVKNAAFRSLRYVGLGKQKEKEEVIDLDSDDEDCRIVSNNSSIEEVEIVDSVGRWKGGRGAVESSQEPNARTTEKGVRSLDSSVVTDVSNATTKVDGMEKTGLLLWNPDDSGGPFYKTLHGRSKERDGKLARINFDIEIQEKRFQRLQLLRPTKIEEPIKKDVAEECFVPLTDEEKTEVSRSLSNSQRRKVLVSHANSCIDITGELLQCLKPGAWLNDEVINLYLELLKEREKREPQKFLKCHFFNTFFYKKLNSGQGGYNFQSVRRWTTQRKLGYSLLECDKIFVPIHKEVHWCLAVINKKDEKFQYLDSLGGVDNHVLNVLAKYLVDEAKDKCGTDLNVSSWEKEFVTELPEQLNGFDCGMFMIKYADFYSRDIGLCFSQDNMPYFRQRTAKEILKLRAD
ncbi:hypothetical protein C2S52_014498 [Perilla frutescens var. hirtella]|nr:hypothetical protein C2S52_014498 [Perilla frutescens var. hirtella]